MARALIARRPTARAETVETVETKGERTARRILDAAERLFAERGYGGASLREIARKAGITQPGLYNHFGSKLRLYSAVLDRALDPMAQALAGSESTLGDSVEDDALAGVMTDILLEHPALASLFQQALQGSARSPGQRLIKRWLDRLLTDAMSTLASADEGSADAADRAIYIIAMFNMTTGYFLSQRALSAMTGGKITDAANVSRQKRLLAKLARVSPGA